MYVAPCYSDSCDYYLPLLALNNPHEPVYRLRVQQGLLFIVLAVLRCGLDLSPRHKVACDYDAGSDEFS